MNVIRIVDINSMSQNEQLRQAFKDWLQAALLLLHNKPLPTYMDIEVTFNPNGWDATKEYSKPSYITLVETNNEELLNLPEVDTILDIVTNSSTLSSVLLVQGDNLIVDLAQQKQKLNNTYLKRLLTLYLKNINTLEFQLTEFEDIYYRLEHYIYSDEPIDAIWLVQLRNLSFIDIDKVLIDQGIYLRKANYEEKIIAVKNYIPRFEGFPPYGRNSSQPDIPSVFLVIHDSITKTQHQQIHLQPHHYQETTQTAQALILALRLLKATPIGVASYYWHILNPGFGIWISLALPCCLHILLF